MGGDGFAGAKLGGGRFKSGAGSAEEVSHRTEAAGRAVSRFFVVGLVGRGIGLRVHGDLDLGHFPLGLFALFLPESLGRLVTFVSEPMAQAEYRKQRLGHRSDGSIALIAAILLPITPLVDGDDARADQVCDGPLCPP